jgi:hypothetical protein
MFFKMHLKNLKKTFQTFKLRKFWIIKINHLIKMAYIKNIFRLRIFVILIGIRIKIKITIFYLDNIINSTYKTSNNYNKSLMDFKIFNKTLQNLKFLKKTYLRRYSGLWKKSQWENNSNKWIHFKNTILFFNKNNIIIVPFKTIAYRQ